MCSLFFWIYFYIYTYHTSEQNIQIFGVSYFIKFFRFLKTCDIINKWKHKISRARCAAMAAHALTLTSPNQKPQSNMGFLENLESYIDWQEKQPESLATKIFSETVCGNCSCKSQNESSVLPITDSMGREIFWGDLGRP